LATVRNNLPVYDANDADDKTMVTDTSHICDFSRKRHAWYI